MCPVPQSALISVLSRGLRLETNWGA